MVNWLATLVKLPAEIGRPAGNPQPRAILLPPW